MYIVGYGGSSMTDEEMIEEFKNKHLESYKKAVQEIVKNNTKSLIEEDIFSLIKKPPLDSMDVIKVKLLSLAKSKHLILESAHPSPFSASYGFFGSHPFSKTNDFLKSQGLKPIDWDLN